MNDDKIKELDNESLVTLLQSLEQLDIECDEIMINMKGNYNG